MGTSLVNAHLVQEHNWVRQMRATMTQEERASFPAVIPWVSQRGREEFSELGLGHLIWQGEEGQLDEEAQRHRAECQEIADECQEAMFHSAEEILGTLTPDLANLIHEVVNTAPTEQYEQVAVLKDISLLLSFGCLGRVAMYRRLWC